MRKKKTSTLFDLVEKSYNSKEKHEWEGSLYKEVIFLQFYLYKKYKNLIDYIPFTEIYITDNYLGPEEKLKGKPFIGVMDLKNKLKLLNKEDMEIYIKDCLYTKRRFTIYPVTLKATRRFGIGSKTIEYNQPHSLMFIYDALYNELELFDSIYQNFNKYKYKIKKFFTKIYGKDLKIYYPSSNPKKYFGYLELNFCDEDDYLLTADGFCLAWSLWYLDLRFSNLHLTRKQVIKKAYTILNTDPTKDICRLIRGYAQFIDKIVNEFEVNSNKENIKIKNKSNGKRYIIPISIMSILGLSGILMFLLQN